MNADITVFYKTYDDSEKLSTLWIKLSWSHNRLIMRVADPRAREWYLREAASQQWSVRELERNINSFYYQRHLESSENATQRATDSNAMNPRQLMKWHRRHYLRG